ncbi:DJ-1/PfpI family protein [Rhodococcus sp. NPDC047139]|uniref:DJ-1/PfpI family protein n=1 Tax=Rhodococcus sp. NPDC047139 TaxID=3155141 RepID=UPI0033E3EBE8
MSPVARPFEIAAVGIERIDSDVGVRIDEDGSAGGEPYDPEMTTTDYGILVFDDVEVLDAFGPFEVFSVAARLTSGSEHAIGGATLVSAYRDRPIVTARGGLRVLTDVSIADAPAFDVLLIPGGVTGRVEQEDAVVSWIAQRADTPVLASVCTGAFLLAAAGVLTDHRVTTHWDDQAELRRRFPALTVVPDSRWVCDRGIYTSAGISAGIDLALHLVSLVDRDLARRVARQMEYRWRESPEGNG